MLATGYAASVWSVAIGDPLSTFVAVRRYPQIWSASFFIVLEAFWVCRGDWKGRLSDWVAALYGVICCNHGVIAVIGLTHGWTAHSWGSAMYLSWGIDALVWAVLAVVFRAGWREVKSHP
jgi:hypothetical protein